jgi:uncharacterized protein
VNPNVKVDDILASIRKSIDSDIETLGGGTASQPRGALMRDALRDMRHAMAVEKEAKATVPAEEVSDLRNRIRKKLEALEDQAANTRPVVQPTPTRSVVVPTHKAFSGILSGPTLRGPTPLRPSFADDEPADDVHYAPAPQPLQQDWSEDPYAYDSGFSEAGQPRVDEGYGQHFGYDTQAYEQPYQESLPGPLMSPQTEAHAETAFRQLSDTILARATGDRSLEDMTRDMLKTMLKQWLDANLPTIVEELVREEIQRVARRGR